MLANTINIFVISTEPKDILMPSSSKCMFRISALCIQILCFEMCVHTPSCCWSTPRRYGPLTRYVKLQVAHAPGMPGTFSPAADFKGNRWLAIPACITARAWRTCRDACRDRLPAVTGKTFPAFPAHAHPQICVSGKRPIVLRNKCNRLSIDERHINICEIRSMPYFDGWEQFSLLAYANMTTGNWINISKLIYKHFHSSLKNKLTGLYVSSVKRIYATGSTLYNYKMHLHWNR